jgi:hypothetical protein
MHQLAADPEAHYPEHPVPLTPQEKQDLDRRQYVQTHKSGLLSFGRANPKVWGGLWTDQQRGGLLVIQFVGDAEEFRSTVARLAPSGAAFELRSVNRSMGDLEALKSAIERDWAEVERLGVSMYAVGLSIRTNQVRVSVSAMSEEVSAWFANRYGANAILLELADAALIGPISDNNISRWVYKTASSVSVITSIQQYWDDAEGDRVCLSARKAAAIRCGTIVDTSLSIVIQPGVLLKQQVRANYDWEVGDSGGAVLNGSMAMGIQSGFVNNDATYSQIGHVQARTSSFVNVSNCGNFC